jgi:predicted dehydrogenase
VQVIDIEGLAPIAAAREGLTLAIHGGLGDPAHSVIGLYAPTLRQFGATLVAVDPQAHDAEQIRRVTDELELHYSMTRTPAEHAERLAAGDCPDAALILTPVATHLGIIDQYARAPSPPQVVLVEKPAVSLREIAALARAVERIGPARCAFIDTAMVSPSIAHAFDTGVVERIGRVRSIVALAVDNPWATPGPNRTH